MKYRYDPQQDAMVGQDGMPMLNQGERAAPPAAPFTISDTQPHVMSMTNGQHYDSKSQMRKEYKRAGVTEVGNDVPMKKPQPSYMERDAAKRKRQASVGRALSQAGFGV